MTIDEASERYSIPLDILSEYESWGLCGAVKKVMGAWQYDDTDLERLSTVMTLHDLGFSPQEVETYMRLMLEGGSDAERLRMLDRRRCAWTTYTSARSSSAAWTTSGTSSGRASPDVRRSKLCSKTNSI